MITIEVCKISSDGRYLDIVASCNKYYEFSNVTIWHYKDRKNGFDITDLFGITGLDGVNIQDISKRISLDPIISLLNDKYAESKMFYVQFTVNEINSGMSTDNYCNPQTVKHVAVSDISNVYRFMLDQLMQICCNRCEVNIPDDVKRMFSILYAHIEAMKLELFYEAELFFDVLNKNFMNCSVNKCGNNMKLNKIINTCNCGSYGRI